MRRTLTGRVIVAVTTDREAATSQGIDSAKITMLTFTFGAMLAALGGALASPMSSMVPGVGASTIVLSFAVVATAGLGQSRGRGDCRGDDRPRPLHRGVSGAGAGGGGAVSHHGGWCCWCGRRACSA
jgi:hypothetical protein